MNTRLASLIRLSLLSLAALAARPAAHVQAQTATATTNPVGYLQTQCLGNSDTLVALPFTRMPAFTGAVASVSGTSGNVVSIANTPGFTAGQFVQNLTATPAQTDTFYLTVGPATAALTGTLSLTENSAAVAGAGTVFTSQLVVGDRLTVNDGYNALTYTVAAIADDSDLTLDRPFVDAAAGSTSAVQSGAATTTTALKPPTVVKLGKPTTRRMITAPTVVKPIPNTPATLTGLAATFDHSPLEGRWYLVTANDTGSVTVALNGDNLGNLAGTQVSIIPCWTLNTLYPASDSGVSFTASPSIFQLNTQIFIPDYKTVGSNLSSKITYFYINDGTHVGWRLFNDSIQNDHGSDPIMPDGYFTVRQDNNSPTVALTFSGSVSTNKLVTPLATNASVEQDNAIGLNRPADVALGSLGLNPGDGSFRASTSIFGLTDQLFLYDNTKTATYKSSYKTYYYLNDGTHIGWRQFNDSIQTDHGPDLIPAGSALTLRKAPTSNGQTAIWSNSPNY